MLALAIMASAGVAGASRRDAVAVTGAAQWVHGWARTVDGLPLVGVEVRIVKPDVPGTMGFSRTEGPGW